MMVQYSEEWFKEYMPEYYAAGMRAEVKKPDWLVAREAGLPYEFQHMVAPRSPRAAGIETGYIEREAARRRRRAETHDNQQHSKPAPVPPGGRNGR